ncbi:MAG: TIGR04552 family protein [Deltaproteobacteria bacterium]|nr:TIGR04552 family protein [Deltaproteobacteria bacterium]
MSEKEAISPSVANESAPLNVMAEKVRANILSLSDLEEVRLILRGGSIVDWYRLNLVGLDEARAFCRLLEGDPDDATDIAYLISLREEAAEYLHEHHDYSLPAHLLICDPIELFLYAAEQKGRRRDRFFSCLLLKTIHILHHVRSRELRYRLPLSQSMLAQKLVDKVDVFADRLFASGFPISEYQGGIKSSSSVITKLLMKPDNHAATVYDRVRFRFVTEEPKDLIPVLHEMTRHLLPFSYVVPGESVNHLVNFSALVESHKAYREHANEFQVELGLEDKTQRVLNESSAATYRVINFIADVPIRVPPSVLQQIPSDGKLFGRSVFHMAEFQVVDKATAEQNERGDNAHDAYKTRQLKRVKERIVRGLRGVMLDEKSGS